LSLKTYISTHDEYEEIAEAGAIRSAKLLLRIIEKKRDSIRNVNENSPKRDDEDLKRDIVFMQGMIHMANWILSLPGEADTFLKNTSRRTSDYGE